MELEESARELHQARVEKGIITRWALYRKLYTGKNDSYSHILVTLNDIIIKTQNSFPQELLDEIYTKNEQSDFMDKIWASRDIVKREYYHRVTFAEGGTAYKYLRFNRLSVEPGSGWTFEQLRKDLAKPLFDEVVKACHNAGWSVWSIDPNDKKFQYVSVNLFAEFGDWKNSIPRNHLFKEVFPDKGFNEARESVMTSRIATKYHPF